LEAVSHRSSTTGGFLGFWAQNTYDKRSMLWQSLPGLPVYRKPRQPLEQAWSIHYTDYTLCLEKGSLSNQTRRRVKPVHDLKRPNHKQSIRTMWGPQDS
jgi:hypothetical protein